MKDLVLRASASSRWLTCPASSKPVKKELAQADYTSEGTRLHGLAYDYITGGIEISELKEEDWDSISTYCNYVKGIVPADAFLETRMTTSFHGATITGQPDAIILKGSSLTIVDMKFAHGKRVEARNNTQLLIGAWLFTRTGDRDVTDLTMVICQGGRIDEVVYSEEETKATFTVLESAMAVAIAQAGADIYVPSEPVCRYCPHIITCPKMIETEKDFQNMQPFPPDLDRLYADAQILKARIAVIEREAFTHLRKGGSLDSWKLVSGRSGNRAWIDEDAASKVLLAHGAKEKEIYKKELISPAQADKLFSVFGGISDLEQLYTKSPPKPTIVSIHDTRPAWTEIEDSDFTNYEQ